MCGGFFGIDEGSAGATLVSATLPFRMDVFSTAAGAQTGATGFNLEYTQLAC